MHKINYLDGYALAYPTLKQLRYLIALERHLHFGHAAQSCHVSQSAFSLAIKDLESLLKVSLVDRTSRSTVFTSLGSSIASQARLALFDVEALMDISRNFQEVLSGTLKVGIIPTVAPFLLPHILKDIHAQFPKLDLYIKEGKTDIIHSSLLDGELDLLILALPMELNNVEILPLFKDRFYLAYHQETRFITPHNFDIDHLNEQHVLLLEDGHCLRNHVISTCNIAQKNPTQRYSASDLYSLVKMVDGDLGISFIPELTVDSGILQGTAIKTQRLADSAHRDIVLAWRKSSSRQQEFNLLAKSITASVTELCCNIQSTYKPS